MREKIIIPKLHGIGGTVQRYETYANLLRDDFHIQRIIYPKFVYKFPFYLRNFLKVLSFYLQGLYFFLRGAKIAIASEFDIIGLLPLKLLGLKLITHVGGILSLGWYLKAREEKKPGIEIIFILLKSIERLVLHLSDYILTVNERQCEILRKDFKIKRNNIMVLSPIDTTKFKPKIKKSKRGFVIGYIGRDDPIKRLDVLKMAFKLLKKKKNIELKIVTDVPHETVPKILNEFDIFVQCSFEIGMGLASLEAMSCGIPVVCYWPAHIKPPSASVITYFPNNPKVLARTIQNLLRNKKFLKKISQESRKYILKYHSEKALKPKLVNLVRKLLT